MTGPDLHIYAGHIIGEKHQSSIEYDLTILILTKISISIRSMSKNSLHNISNYPIKLIKHLKVLGISLTEMFLINGLILQCNNRHVITFLVHLDYTIEDAQTEVEVQEG